MGEEEEWAADICDNLGAGASYCLCPCFFGVDAVNKVGADVGGIELCGIDMDNWFCWVFCEVAVIRTLRGAYRGKYNKSGNCCVDYLCAEYCPGCALAQMEADLESKGGGGVDTDSGTTDMER